MALLAPQEARAGLQEGPTQLRKGPGEQGPAGRGTTKLIRSHSFSLSLIPSLQISQRAVCARQRTFSPTPGRRQALRSSVT